MEPINVEAYGVAALSILSALVFRLIDLGLLPKDEIIADLAAITGAKVVKDATYHLPIEGDAAALAVTLATDIANRFSKRDLA